MDSRTQHRPPDKRSRQAKPKRVVIGGKTFERNDVVASRHASSKRTIDRRDKKGAPYAFIAGVKYRPQPDYDDFVVADIIERDQPKQEKPRPPKRPRRR